MSAVSEASSSSESTRPGRGWARSSRSTGPPVDVYPDPSVDAHAGGDFTVAWTRTDGNGDGVFGRRFNPAGAPRGPEFQINTYTTNRQARPAVAAGPGGNFVVVWEGWNGGNSFEDIFGQRFAGLSPTLLRVDTAGNGMFEPGETVDVRPTWQNTNASPETFGGTLSGIFGPPGPTYTITDAVGDYGTVASGASGECTDCYAITVSNPATRPAQHWDAFAVETIVPQSQQKQWRAHVGASFVDVGTADPFYRFIETLLHHNITGGCFFTQYCPASATTREQMAVFVIGAKDGSFLPPACTTPVFNDVPATNPFCRFIEELARRGVVSGCGGGNYCPTSAVTREQMAVFVLRTLDPTLSPPACTTPIYNDVPASSLFCRWIEELTRRGVVVGCGGGNYCPTAAVTREQMGVFITVTFGLTLYGP